MSSEVEDRMSSDEGDRQNVLRGVGQTGCRPRWRTDRMFSEVEDRMCSEEDRQNVL